MFSLWASNYNSHLLRRKIGLDHAGIHLSSDVSARISETVLRRENESGRGPSKKSGEVRSGLGEKSGEVQKLN